MKMRRDAVRTAGPRMMTRQTGQPARSGAPAPASYGERTLGRMPVSLGSARADRRTGVTRRDDRGPTVEVQVRGGGRERQDDWRRVPARRDEGEDRRAGARQAGAERAGLARGLDEPRQLRVDGRPVRLVEPVDGQVARAARSARSRARRRRSRPRPGCATASRAGPFAGRTARMSSVERRSSGMNRTARRSRGRVEPDRPRHALAEVGADTTKPPSSAAAALSGWPSIVARRGRSSSAVVSASPASALPASDAADRRRRGRPEAARQRDPVVHRDPPADARRAARREPHGRAASRPRDEAVVAVRASARRRPRRRRSARSRRGSRPGPRRSIRLVMSRARGRGSRSRRRGSRTTPGTSTVTRRPSSSASQLARALSPTSRARRRPSRRSARPRGTRRDLALGRRRVLEAVAGQDAHDGRVAGRARRPRAALVTPATLAADDGSQKMPS